MPASNGFLEATFLCRVAKLSMVAGLAAFALLVAFNNITDYQSNFMFVQHVLDMDTTFQGNTLTWRAIPEHWAWHLFYGLIIAGEALTGFLFALATIDMARALRAETPGFERAKRFVPPAAALGFLVWFSGFSVVGGEWFVMWQSQTWNGQQPAFRFFVTMLLVCLFVKQPE